MQGLVRLVATPVLVCLLLITTSAGGHRPRDAQAPVTAVVDFDCLSTNFPRQRLARLIRRAMVEDQLKPPAVWCDRAFPYDVNGDGRREYFIPLSCGATGNCSWGVFSLQPKKLLGVVSGEYIYIRKPVGGWPALSVTAHVSVSEGYVATYGFRQGRYVKVADGYEYSAMEHNAPSYTGTIHSPCRQ